MKKEKKDLINGLWGMEVSVMWWCKVKGVKMKMLKRRNFWMEDNMNM